MHTDSVTAVFPSGVPFSTLYLPAAHIRQLRSLGVGWNMPAGQEQHLAPLDEPRFARSHE